MILYEIGYKITTLYCYPVSYCIQHEQLLLRNKAYKIKRSSHKLKTSYFIIRVYNAVVKKLKPKNKFKNVRPHCCHRHLRLLPYFFDSKFSYISKFWQMERSVWQKKIVCTIKKQHVSTSRLLSQLSIFLTR